MQKVSVFNYQLTNSGAKSCDIYIDNMIVDAETDAMIKLYYGENLSTSFNDIRSQVDAAIANGCTILNIKVNCSGGNVFEAFAMNDYLNSLKSKNITVNRVGIGLVASAATIIVSGPGSTISPNCIYMIHDASGGVWGTVSEVESYAVMIRKVNNQITEHFVNCTGASTETIGNMMLAETWMIGQEAVDLGFVENCNDTGYTVTNKLTQDKWIFNNTKFLGIYNSFTKTNNDMNIKQLVLDALKEAGLIKNDADTKNYEKVAAALEASLKPVTDGIDQKVTDAVTKALEAKETENKTAIQDAVKEVLKDFKPADMLTKEDIKDLATTKSVTDEIKKVTDELEETKKTIANKKGKETKDPKDEGGAVHPGVTWQTN